MPRLTLTLNDAEIEALSALAERAGVTPQALLRAGLYLLAPADAASDRRDRVPETAHIRRTLCDKVLRLARKGATLTSAAAPGQRRGYGREDYEAAWRERGSVNGVARALGVNRRTAREMLDAYGLR